MILGVGIDLIEIERFAKWHLKSDEQLLRVLSEEEIDYCKKSLKLSAGRFAARFAAREAAYKAWSQAFTQQKISFFRFCKTIEVRKDGEIPVIHIDYQKLGMKSVDVTFKISLTHSRTTAGAIVVISS